MFPIRRKVPPPPVIAVLVTLALLAVPLGLGVYRIGSTGRALAYLRGQRVFVAEPIRRLGTVEPGRDFLLRFPIVNYSGVPVHIAGASSSCSCTIVSDLPTTIAGHTSKPIEITVRSPSVSQDIHTTITLYTDSPGSREIALQITGRVDNPREEELADVSPPVH